MAIYYHKSKVSAYLTNYTLHNKQLIYKVKGKFYIIENKNLPVILMNHFFLSIKINEILWHLYGACQKLRHPFLSHLLPSPLPLIEWRNLWTVKTCKFTISYISVLPMLNSIQLNFCPGRYELIFCGLWQTIWYSFW